MKGEKNKMERKNKRFLAIILVLFGLFVVAIFVFGSRLQIGSNIIWGQYYDSACEAFEKSENIKLDNNDCDVLTLDINDSNAIWIAEIDNQIELVQMAKQDGKYSSTDNTDFIEDEEQLGDTEIHSFKLNSEDKIKLILIGEKDRLSKDIKKEKYQYKAFYSNVFKQEISVYYIIEHV